MRKIWLILCVSSLLMIGLLPLGCSYNSSLVDPEVGGDWNPEGLGVSSNMYGDDSSRGVSLSSSSPSLSPDGSKIAYRLSLSKGHSEIWVKNVDGSGQVRVGGVPRHYWINSIVWSADGARITYTGLDMFPSSDSQYERGPDITHTVNVDGSSY